MSSLAGIDWTFSRGTVADIPDVMVVMGEAFDPVFGEAWTAPQCSGILGLPGTNLLVARVKSEPAGFALTRMIVDEAELLLLAVRPMFGRYGIGRSLLITAIDDARQFGVKTMHLEVRADNPALRLYDSIGFAQVGIRPGYYRGKDGVVRNALTYRCILDEVE